MDNAYTKAKEPILSHTHRALVLIVRWLTIQPISVRCFFVVEFFVWILILIKFIFSAVIDVATGEYGHEYIDKMISSVDNGRCLNWAPYDAITENNYCNEKLTGDTLFLDELEEDINPEHLRSRSSSWEQFWTLYKRRTIQMWRDSVSLARKPILLHKIHPKIPYWLALFILELLQTANLHDILFGVGCWWYLPRNR